MHTTEILKRDKNVNFHIINWIAENCLRKRKVAADEFDDVVMLLF